MTKLMSGEGTVCSICQECVGMHETSTSTLPCGHMFHATCLVPWLWTCRSCPNCRFEAQEHTDGDDEELFNALHPQLIELIQEARAQRAERTRILRRNMRLARLPAAPRELLKHVHIRQSMEIAMKSSRQMVRECAEKVRTHERELQLEYNELHRRYRADVAKARDLNRERARHDTGELNRARGILRRQQASYNKSDETLRSQIF